MPTIELKPWEVYEKPEAGAGGEVDAGIVESQVQEKTTN